MGARTVRMIPSLVDQFGHLGPLATPCVPNAAWGNNPTTPLSALCCLPRVCCSGRILPIDWARAPESFAMGVHYCGRRDVGDDNPQGRSSTISCSVAQLKPSSREETPDTLWGSSQRALVPRISSVMVPPSCGATNHHRHTLSGRLIQCGDISSVLLLASWSWAWNPPLPLCRSRQSLEGSSSLHAEVRKEVGSLNVMALATSRALS